MWCQQFLKTECLGLPLEENLHSPFESLLIVLLHDAMALDPSQPFIKDRKKKKKRKEKGPIIMEHIK